VDGISCDGLGIGAQYGAQYEEGVAFADGISCDGLGIGAQYQEGVAFADGISCDGLGIGAQMLRPYGVMEGCGRFGDRGNKRVASISSRTCLLM
jgi:hypothetical protein